MLHRARQLTRISDHVEVEPRVQRPQIIEYGTSDIFCNNQNACQSCFLSNIILPTRGPTVFMAKGVEGFFRVSQDGGHTNRISGRYAGIERGEHV